MITQPQEIASKNPANRVLKAICSTYWAMLPNDLEVLLKIAKRESELDPQAVSALMSTPLENTNGALIRSGVAIIPVIGPITRYGSMFSRMSGATSIDTLATDFNAALTNPRVKAILFEVDSPGGEVAGIAEFANMVYQARQTSDKPIWSYVSDHGASGAYWIASATERIVVSPTSILGSIGVVAALRKNDNKDVVQFVSSKSPNKRPDLDTEEGKSEVQSIVDSLADVFINSVARNRGVDADTVVNNFGAGGVRVGAEAVECGLADEMGSFESCIIDLSEDITDDAIVSKKKKPDYNTELDSTLTQPRPKRFIGMSLADKYNAVRNLFLADDGDIGDDNVSDNQVVEPMITENGAATTKGVTMDRLAQLEAENARLKAERWNAEAAAFVKIALADGRAFPTEKEALNAMFVQLCADDATLGATASGISRVDLLTKCITARPMHQLTSESLAPSLATLLRQAPQAESTNMHGDAPVTEDDVHKLLSKTSLGNSVLTQIKSGR